MSKEDKSESKKETVSSGAARPAGKKATNTKKQFHQHTSPSWDLEADRIAIHHPLIESLQILAGHYDRRISSNALMAGLPITDEGITPLIFIRAAERADLNAAIAERSLSSLAIAPTLPCVLVLNDNQACILWDIKERKKKNGQSETGFVVQFPETRDEKKTIGQAEFEKLYSGYAFFVRPVARHDERAGPKTIDTARDWFWGALKKNKTIYIEVAIAAVMINLFAIASPLFTMNVYDRVVPNNAFDTLWVLASGIGIVYFFDFLLKNLRAHFLDVAGRKADVQISAMLFEQVLGMTMKSRPQSAGLLASHMKDFEGLRDFFTSATLVALIDLPFVFLFIAVLAIIGGPIAFVPLAAIPLVVGVGLYLQKPLKKVVQQSMMESAVKNALLFETIVGLETIKVQAAEGHSQARWEELTDKAARTAVKSRKLAAFAQYWTAFIQQLVSVAIVIAGVYLISEGMLSMGGLIACVMLSSRALAPLGQIAGLLTRFNQSRESLTQLDEMMKREVERPAGKNFISVPRSEGRVEFRDVTFNYPGQSVPALKNVNFVIEPGERVAIIGAVGSGKTTIERLLINLYEPTSGSVQIDGMDVRQIDPGDLRRNVGAVQQSPQLFFGSVRHNITMGHETTPDRAVIKAAELSGVLEFLRDSQAGLDTQVGERGEALSGGQRQAVAIARALLYDPPIMVMDEPTAAMDPASENRLKKRLEDIGKSKTVIVITHKGAMLSLVDKIILMDRGQVVAYGPKEEVIRKLQAREYGTAAENTKV